MQKDLKFLAMEMQNLSDEDKKFYLYQLTHYEVLLCIESDCHRRFKRKLLTALSRKLSWQDPHGSNPLIKRNLVKNGIDAYAFSSEKEQKEFRQVVQEGFPRKVATKTSRNSSVTVKTRIHE